MWIRSANSHTGQQLNAASQAGQMAASNYVAELPKTACNRRGVHRSKAGISSKRIRADRLAGRFRAGEGRSSDRVCSHPRLPTRLAPRELNHQEAAQSKSADRRQRRPHRVCAETQHFCFHDPPVGNEVAKLEVRDCTQEPCEEDQGTCLHDAQPKSDSLNWVGHLAMMFE